MFDFTNRVVVITGAAGNLGTATANAFWDTGARLVLMDRSPDRLQKLFPALADSPQHFLAHSVDLNDASSVEKMAVENFEEVDKVISVSGLKVLIVEDNKINMLL